MKYVLIACLIFISTSYANMVGNDTQNFNPSTSGISYITVQSSSTLHKGYLSLSAFLDYAKNVLPDVTDEFGRNVDSNDSVVFSALSIGYGLTERVGLGLTVSTIHDQTSNRKIPGAQFASTGLNEIRASAKYNFLLKDRFGMAVMGSTNFNEVINNPFLGQKSDPTYNLQLIADYDLDHYQVAINVGYRFRNPGKALPQSYYEPLYDQYIASVGFSYFNPYEKLHWISEIYASKLVKSASTYDADKISAEGLLGFKYDQNQNVSWTAGVGLPVSRGIFIPDYRAFAGITCIFDTQKRAARTEPAIPPPIKKEVVATAPAPQPNIIRKTVISKYGYQPEDIEKMRNVPFDEMSQSKEFVLRTAVEISAAEKDKPPFELLRLEGFDFDFASNAIRPEYNTMFENVARYLNSKPDIVKMRIEGHTDSVGSPERNRIRSQGRADAVKEFLWKKGVNRNIPLDSVGYGADRPVADNGNPSGRKKNRRVEIRILRQINPLINQTDQ